MLKNRLNVIEYYRNLHGIENAYWPHYFLRNTGTHVWKYKFHYAFKAFLAYNVYREIRNFRYRNNTEFLTTFEQN